MSDTSPRPLPTGTVTFLFTDIEGSTRLWELYPRAMQAALARHDVLLREAIEARGGYVFKTVGDAFCAAFPTASQGLEAALAAQRALQATDWPSTGITDPLRVRMGLHTGAAEERDGDYFGPPLNRAARLMSAGYGGQILLSLATQQLVRDHVPPDVGLRDLGEGGLKDLVRSEHVYQVVAPDLPADFPPLKSLDPRYIEPVSTDGGEGEPRQLVPMKNPYKGLRAFQGADAPDFFGREALTERLLSRVAQTGELTRFLAVVGPSGSGKSSVVRAGLIPALKRGKAPGSERWLAVEMLPSAHPFEELDAVLSSINANPNPPATLLELLRDDERGLLRAARRVLPQDESVELVLVIDQFEEVFTLVADEAERVQFLEALYAAVTDPRSRLRVVITLRADFYDRPLLYPNPGELVRQRTEVVLPLSAEELERAIVRPAQRVGVTCEAELVAAIVKDVGEQPGALPLLQYALTELFERRVGRQLTLDAYRESGGVLGALSHRADEIYDGLDEAEQAIARQMFLRLVTLGEGVEDTRRRARTSELYSIGVSEMIESDIAGKPALDRVMEAFGRGRLLTFDRDPVTHSPTVEVAHEALIRTWPRLREWLDAGRSDLRVHRQLMAAAGEWANNGRDPSYLATGARLAQFETLASLRSAETGSPGGVALNEEERAYLGASIQRREQEESAERERQRHELELAQRTASAQRSAAARLRILVGGLAVFLGLALALAIFAFDRQAEATTQRQAAQSSAATAVANGFEAGAQRATAVANGAAADSARATAVADFAHADALRLAAEANRVMDTGGPSELAGLLSLRSIETEYTPQGDAALEAAARLEYPARYLAENNGVAEITIFSPDGEVLLTQNSSGLQEWDSATGQQLASFDFGGSTLSFSPDGRYIAASRDEGTVNVWDTVAMTETLVITEPLDAAGETPAVNAAVYSPDGRYILSSSMDGTARVWDATDGHQIHVFQVDTPLSTGLAWSPDGEYIVTGGSDNLARLWDVQTGVQLRTFDNGAGDSPTHGVLAIAYSPDGQTFATSAGDGNVEVWIWDAATGALLHKLVGHTGLATRVAYSPDGKALLTSGGGGIWLWDVATGERLAVFHGPLPGAASVGLSPDGRHAAASYEGGTLLWDITRRPDLPIFTGHTALLWSVAFSADDRTVLTGSNDRTARLWDAATGRQLQPVFRGPKGSSVNSAAFSPDGKHVLTANGAADKGAHIWDMGTGAEVQSLYGHGKLLIQAVYSPDGQRVLTGSGDNTAWLWEAATGRPVLTFTGHTNWVNGVAYAPDGKTVMTGSADHSAALWDALTGKQIRRITDHTDTVEDVAYSPDGKRVLTGSLDGTARLWDFETGALLGVFSARDSAIAAVAFSPDGKSILAGTADHLAHLWDISGVPAPDKPNWGRSELRSFAGHSDEVKSVAFSHDGKLVLTGSADGTARLWHTDYHDTMRYLCGQLARDLTGDERTQYNITGSTPTCPGR
jgi:WD40 repeat protein/class 3 adenylate cyclase